MPIKPRNTDNVRSTQLGAATDDHAHAHADLTGVSADQHHAEDHTVASHSDTTATGAELETLTDGSDADSLHTHATLTPLTQEQVEDFVGAMLSGNTETLITVTYQDADGTIDFVVDADLSNYTNTEGWIADITGSPLSELQDVTITSIASGELLKWNGTTWINQTLAEAGISAVGHTHTESDVTDLDHNDADAIHDNVSGEIAAVTEKASPVSADLILIEDSAASNAKKRVQAGNLAGSLDHGGFAGLADDDHTQYLLADGTREATYIDIGGLTGATAASRYVGAVNGAPPTSGTFAVGDYVVNQDGGYWVCSVAGTPGTWTPVGVSSVSSQNYYSGVNAGLGHTGVRCVVIGNGAMSAGSSANDSIAIGSGALGSQTTGSTNFGIGFRAGINITTGNSNLAIGNSALLNNMAGSENTAVGNGSLSAETDFRNTAIGASAGNAHVGNNSTFIGRAAGSGITSGGEHVFIGHLSGFAGTTQPTHATVVGAEAKAGDGNNGLAVGYKTSVSASGAVAIGTNSSGVGATATVANDFVLGTSSHNVKVPGTIQIAGNIGFYGTTPVAQSPAYTPTNVTTDRSYDANSTTLDEVADVLGTLIADLQATGLIG